MNKNWSVGGATPGGVRQVYGAQYPPLQVASSPSKATAPTPHKQDKQHKFQNYENSVNDAWEPSVRVDGVIASSSAARVLARHAASREQVIMPPVSVAPAKNGREQAMQRLAIQREPLPTTKTSDACPSIYPRLVEIATDEKHPVAPGSEASDRDRLRFARLQYLLLPRGAAGRDIDLDKLREDCWLGIPHTLRPQAWRVLSGYLPTKADRRDVTMQMKRDEYWHYVEQYLHTRFDEPYSDTFRQIHIDIPRMCPLIQLFQQKLVQEIFERILYIWSIRHPASGYVQGINDLVTPFFVVFLSEYVPDDVEVGSFDLSQLELDVLHMVEADSFWCMSSLLDCILDNYTFAQPGIQRKVLHLSHLMQRVDAPLHDHLRANQVEYLQFAFRWMNNILMRELPLRATIRLWDTYLSEKNGFSLFHGYVCAAFLRTFSRSLQQEKDFQAIMLLLQNLPTQNWGDQQICELTADAFSLMTVFEGTRVHN